MKRYLFVGNSDHHSFGNSSDDQPQCSQYRDDRWRKHDHNRWGIQYARIFRYPRNGHDSKYSDSKLRSSRRKWGALSGSSVQYGGGGGMGGGGALFIDAASVTLSNVTLSSNQAKGGNGGNARNVSLSSTIGGSGGGGLNGGSGGAVNANLNDLFFNWRRRRRRNWRAGGIGGNGGEGELSGAGGGGIGVSPVLGTPGSTRGIGLGGNGQAQFPSTSPATNGGTGGGYGAASGGKHEHDNRGH